MKQNNQNESGPTICKNNGSKMQLNVKASLIMSLSTKKTWKAAKNVAMTVYACVLCILSDACCM